MHEARGGNATNGAGEAVIIVVTVAIGSCFLAQLPAGHLETGLELPRERHTHAHACTHTRMHAHPCARPSPVRCLFLKTKALGGDAPAAPSRSPRLGGPFLGGAPGTLLCSGSRWSSDRGGASRVINTCVKKRPPYPDACVMDTPCFPGVETLFALLILLPRSPSCAPASACGAWCLGVCVWRESVTLSSLKAADPTEG